MSESDEAVDVSDVDVGNVIEIDLDAETEEVEGESADPTSEADTDEDLQSSEGAEVAPEDEDAETQTPTQEPFSFQVDGTTIDVPGAVVSEMDDGEGGKEDWIAMPRSAFQESVQPHVADRAAWQRQEAVYQRKITDLDPTNNPTVIEALSLNERWKEVTGLSSDEFAAWAENGQESMKVMQLEAENKALRDSREVVEASESDSNTEQKHAELHQLAGNDLQIQVTDAMQRLGLELPSSVQKEVIEHLWGRIQGGENIYFEGEDGPMVQTGRIDQMVKLFAGSREAGAVKAEKANAPKKKVPRQVAAQGSSAPAKDTKKYDSKADWESAMGLNN